MEYDRHRHLDTPAPALELWGGVECTVNRIGDTYTDQLVLNGHATRIADLDQFAALGLRALRYPVLWERTAPEGLAHADWTWADARLARMRELGIRPIVGLVHHGSGPRDTSLVDPAFPERLAEFAGAVAARYPWVEDYTPVNEPLTTARFSGLYGYWYPHGHDDATFVRTLLTQCRAVACAMQAIRAVNPRARLVQTEDLGKVFSTPALAYQAAFENERRWLSFDLLCGRVNTHHPLWSYLRESGATVAELDWFCAHPCPPNVMGINSYLTSERFLDDRVQHYPDDARASNGRQTYVDVAAVHVRVAGMVGHRTLLRETWERYGLPIAVTEAHAGGTREEQVRWLYHVWQAAQDARAAGADVRAVTVWALLGTYDWSSLLTRQVGDYEPGAFDVRSLVPRPTALAHIAYDLAHGKAPQHPALDTPGWWERPERLCFGCTDNALVTQTYPAARVPSAVAAPRPLLIAGANGILGRAFVWACEMRSVPYHAVTRATFDIADAAQVNAVLDHVQPWGVVNAAGYVRVDDAERDVARCFRENADGPATLAAACARRGAQFLTFSSALVFDGGQREPYVESDWVAPLNVYGRSKAEAEQRVRSALASALVVRASAFFGPWDASNFVTQALETLARGEQFAAAADVVVSPTYVPDLVHVCLDLLADGAAGIWHLSNAGALNWAELARRAATLAGSDPARVIGVPVSELDWAAQRPAYSALHSARATLMPSLESALARYWQASATQERTR